MVSITSKTPGKLKRLRFESLYGTVQEYQYCQKKCYKQFEFVDALRATTAQQRNNTAPVFSAPIESNEPHNQNQEASSTSQHQGSNNKPKRKAQDQEYATEQKPKKNKQTEGGSKDAVPKPKRQKSEDAVQQTPTETTHPKIAPNSEHGLQPPPTFPPETVFILNPPWTLKENDLKKLISDIPVQPVSIHFVKPASHALGQKGCVGLIFQAASEQQQFFQAIQQNPLQFAGKKLKVSTEAPSNTNLDSTSSTAHSTSSTSSSSKSEYKIPEGSDPFSVFLKNLPKLEEKVLQPLIQDRFVQFGEIKKVKFVYDKEKHLKNFAYVEYKEESSVLACLSFSASNTFKIGDGASSHVIAVVPNLDPARNAYKKQQSVNKLAVEPKRKTASSMLSLMPRTVQRTTAVAAKNLPKPSIPSSSQMTDVDDGNASGETSTQTPMKTNADFQAMLRAGKK